MPFSSITTPLPEATPSPSADFIADATIRTTKGRITSYASEGREGLAGIASDVLVTVMSMSRWFRCCGDRVASYMSMEVVAITAPAARSEIT